MATAHSDEFKRDAVCIALTSGLTRRQTSGHHRAIEEWGVLIKSNHEGYIDWQAYKEMRVLKHFYAALETEPMAA